MVEVKADALEESFEQFEEDGVAELKAELEQLKAKIAAGVIAAQRPALDGVKSAEASAFVDQYIRRGIESGLETKAIGSSSDAIGGYAVPQEIDQAIDQTLASISPIRSIANVVKVGSAGYRKLIASGGTPSGWVGFEDARPETNTPAFNEVVPPSGDLYANPAVSQQMLDDAMFDVEAFLAQEIATEFARAEGAAFVAGTGVSQPLGFLSSPNSAALDPARPMGTLQFIGTGAAGAFPGSNPADKLIDLVQSLRSPYRQGAVFVMNSATAAAVRKFKTADGAFMFQPSLAAGQPATLLGYPLIEAEDMPDIAANSLSIAFGNFKAGYVIAERNATTILRDPYTHKPYVHFYATYSYSVSLAVALSSRLVQSVGRIWADGKLLRGAAGDLKVSTKLRIYTGNEDQDVDPLIASAEGLANTPAFRGLALAIFEDLELADYGNRIPFLTFEVFADDAALTGGEILNDASAGLIESTDEQAITGYAAYGQSIAAAIQPLVECYSIELFDDGSQLVTPDAVVTEIGDEELGNSSDNRPASRIQREQLASASLPSVLRLGYYDPALDYQAGEARATSANRRGTEDQLQLPAVVSAGEAKSLAQSMIAREWAHRDKLTLRLPPHFLALQPGARIGLDLSPSSWRVEQVTIDGFVVIAELRPSWSSRSSIAADAGRIVAGVDMPAAEVTLALFDVPDVLELGSATPTLLLAASAPSAGWKASSVEIVAGEQSFQTQTARRKTLLGRASTVLATGDPYLINQSAAFEIELIDQDQWLTSCDDEALVGGSNLAILGSEVLQFGAAEPLGGGRFRLSRLLRGRAGTEWAMDSHSIGEAFALVEPDALRAVALPSWAAGASVNASIETVIGTTSSAAIVLSAESLRPVTPVNLNAMLDGDGNLALAWTRRSRKGFAWIDEIDAPLGESSEQYRISVAGADAASEFQAMGPTLLIPAAQIAEIGSGPIMIQVQQVGDAAVSRAATLNLAI